jgi:hypothetical protein
VRFISLNILTIIDRTGSTARKLVPAILISALVLGPLSACRSTVEAEMARKNDKNTPLDVQSANTSSSEVSLSWPEVSSAAAYRVTISSDSDCSSVINLTTTTNASLNIGMGAGDSVFICIEAMDSSGKKIKGSAKKGIEIVNSTPISPPVADVPEGEYVSQQTVTLNSPTSGTVIHHTTDASTPQCDSPTGPITLSSSMILKAISCKSNGRRSEVSTFTYTINGTVATPVFSVAPGSYATTQTIAISSPTSGAIIRYTIDGSTPTNTSPIYTGTLTVASSQTIKAIAIKTNYNDSPVASAVYDILTFDGIAQVSMAGASASQYILVIHWPKITGLTDLSRAQYQIFANTSGTTPDFSGSPLVTASGSQIHAVVSIPKATTNAVFRMRAIVDGTSYVSSSKTVAFAPQRKSVFRIGSMRVFHGESLTDGLFMNARDARLDPYGNIILGDYYGVINAICNETTQASYCRGKSIGQIFTIAGSDANDNGSDDQIAPNSTMGVINDLAIDGNGNIFITDSTFNKIRVLCFSVSSGGACQGRLVNHVYTLIGASSGADTADATLAAGAGTGSPSGLLLIGHNIFYGDNTYYRLRLLCFDPTGPCAGKVSGNHYRIAGTGVAGDGTTGAIGTVATGTISSLAADSSENLFFSDTQFKKIRSVCLNTTSGYCAAKTANTQYVFIGSGTAGDTADGSGFISNIGSMSGITFDGSDNLLVSDTTYFRIRIACQTTNGLCNGKSASQIFSLSGTGVTNDGATNVTLSSSGLGSIYRLRMSNGALLATDTSYSRVRYACLTNSTPVCASKTLGNIYRLFETSTRYDGSPILASDIEGGVSALGTDKKGNMMFFSWNDYKMRILCVDASFGFCAGKAVGYAYVFAGTGATNLPSVDGVAALSSPIQEVRGVATDSLGNIYLAEYRSHYLDVICVNVSGSKGPCAGKSAGYLYHLVGTGSDTSTPASVYAGNNVAPATQGTSFPQNVLIDAADNVYLMNYQTYTRIAVICYDVTATGFCQGKTLGNLYNYLGTNTASCSQSATTTGVVAASSGTCKNYGAIFDQYENMLLASYYPQSGIDVICSSSQPNQGVCSGKISGNYYRLAGTGSLTDGADGAAATVTFGRGRNIAVDSSNNIVYETDTGTTRIFCNDVSDASGFCGGKTIGNVYKIGDTTPGAGLASGGILSLGKPSAISGTGAMSYVNNLYVTSRGGTISIIFP